MGEVILATPLIPYRLIFTLIFSFHSAGDWESSSHIVIVVHSLLLTLLVFALYLLPHAPTAVAAILRYLMNLKQVFVSAHLLSCRDLDCFRFLEELRPLSRLLFMIALSLTQFHLDRNGW